MPDPKGLVFTLVESGPDMSEEEYHDWYDNEHAPARLTIPSFYNATRFKACDGVKPTSLTLYDISEPRVANGPEYQAVFANGSDRDKRMVSTLQYLTRRSYSVIYSLSHPEASAFLPPKFVFYVAMEVKPEGEAYFNKWFKEEHIPMVMKIPGWLRSRKFTLEEHILFRGCVEPEVPVYKHLAIHDFSSDGYRETAEMKVATSTPWQNEVMKNVVGREMRHFEFLKVYKCPETTQM
ncbi:hypothetical protein D9758_014906 [Tetrapyrgos nigripes]|uniref:Uncharacterized protein n=1 Tax=Tetrapyrgos nigripes TaxID=182062 RepID=A0A8H5CEN4_9AGAR|nr:hypothetical protein D9758_014906 [Tetrapyrgos nigripes]